MTTTHMPPQEWDLRERPTSTRAIGWRHIAITHNTLNQQDRIYLQPVQQPTTPGNPVSNISSDEGNTAVQDQERTMCFYYMLSFMEE